MTNPWNLTPREAEVMAALVKAGALCKAVAIDMGLSPKTVDTFYGRAAEKMGARTRTQALLEFDRWAQANHRTVQVCPQCHGVGHIFEDAA